MKFPRKISIGFQEGTCPLRCNKCLAFGKAAEKKKEICKMPMDKAKLLIDEIAQMEEVPIIQPHIYTEPFANPDLRELISYCNERKVAMSIITNGILVDDEWIDFLVESTGSNYAISFSLDAVTQEVYEKVRGQYKLAQIEAQIDKLMQKRGEKGPRVTVNFTVEEDNDREALEFIDKWKYKVDGVRVTVGIDAQRKVPIKYRQHKGGFDAMDQKCGFMEDGMAIDADGHVRSCVFDAFGVTDFGDVFQMGILGIWNSEPMMQQRRMQAEGTLPQTNFCVGCEAGVEVMKRSKIVDDFIINESDYAIYYNLKDRYKLPL